VKSVCLYGIRLNRAVFFCYVCWLADTMGSSAKLFQLITDRGSTLQCSSFLKKVPGTYCAFPSSCLSGNVIFSLFCNVEWMFGRVLCVPVFFVFSCSWRVGISLSHTPSPCSPPLRIIIPLVYSDTLHLVNLLVHSVTSLFNIDVLCLPQVEG